MATLMETDYPEEEVVENPTLKAAYNLAPLHQNQPLNWNFEVDLVGNKVDDKILHICEICMLPILIYGRLVPCKHIFCFDCARNGEQVCKRCPLKVQKVEELALGTVYVCSHGAPKNSTEGCRRTYLSQRDLQSHIVHRHVPKPASESKTSQAASQPQLPLTQQQAAALQHQHSNSPSSNAVPHSQANFMATNVSQHSQHSMSSSSPYAQVSPRDALSQYTHHTTVPGISDSRTNSTMSLPSSHASIGPAQSHLNHGVSYNQPTVDQGIYRSVDRPNQIPQQQSMHQQQRPVLMQQQPQHLQMPQQQQQQRLPLPMSHGSTMSPTMTTPPGVMRFNQPLQNSAVSSSLSTQQQQRHPGPRMNQFQTPNPGSGSDQHMSTLMRHQRPPQNVNPPRSHQVATGAPTQRGMPGQASQQFIQQSSNMGMTDFDHRQQQRNMDDFGSNRQNVDNLNASHDMDDSDMRTLPGFGNVPQRNRTPSFNNQQDVDEFRTSQQMDNNFNNNLNNRTNSFNNSPSPGMMMSSTNTNNQPILQTGTGMSRGKNVNLITVPLQDEGQYRPIPYVSQSQGAGNVSSSQFTSNNSMTPLNSSSQLLGPRPNNTIRPGLNRMPRPVFNQAANPRPLHSPSMMDNRRMSQPTNVNLPQQQRLPPQGNNPSPNLIMNNRNSMSGGNTNSRMPMNGMAQTSNMPRTGSMQFQGQGTLRMPTNPGGMVQQRPNQPRMMNNPQAQGNWSDEGNMRPIQQRMGQQNLPNSTQGDSSFQQRNYY